MQIHPYPSPTAARALLGDCDLPVEDLSDAHFADFLACGDPAAPGGIVGLEVLGDVALLRSLAVSEAARGQGCGGALVEAIESVARQRGVHALFLLTTTAEEFFAARDYVAIDREQVPDAVRASAEFSALCPASAVVMRKPLR